MYYWIFATLYTFFSIIIAQFFIEQNLRLIFYLIALLLYICLNNVYYSVKYYIELRNHKGIKGDRGSSGDSGQDGSNGTCIMAKGCGLVNCRELIDDQLSIIYPSYKKINQKINDNISLTTHEKKQLKVFDNYINILVPQCEKFNGELSEFKKIIKETLKN